MPSEPFEELGPYYDAVMSRVPYRAWADYVLALVDAWGGSAGTVLDLACGTGAVGLELARRGSRVVGVDRVRSMLAAGRRKPRSSRMGFVQQDMRRLGLSEAFDLVVCLFDSLNYVLELDDLVDVFVGVRRALRGRGLFVFDVNTEFALEEELFTQDDLGHDAPVRLRWRSKYDRATRRTKVDMEFYLEDGRTLRETHVERAYTAAELRGAVEQTGFRTLAVYDAYTFDLGTRTSDRLFYVCRPLDTTGEAHANG